MVVLYKNPSRQLTTAHNGFTLIELLVVISIAALLMTIAVPNLKQMIGHQRVKAAANDFKSAVALGRSQAIKRRTTVSIRKIGETSGPFSKMSNGWHAFYRNGSTSISFFTHALELHNINLTGNARQGIVLAEKTGGVNTGTVRTVCFAHSDNNIPVYKVTVNKMGTAVVTKLASC
jgi:prepilin-type N-terminal cleavage/methylation domain-containing protein